MNYYTRIVRTKQEVKKDSGLVSAEYVQNPKSFI